MYMPTPPDAIGVASEHNQLVSWYTSNEIQIFPLNYFSPFTLTRKQHACFRHCWHSCWQKQNGISFYDSHLVITNSLCIFSVLFSNSIYILLFAWALTLISISIVVLFFLFFFFRLATILGCVGHFIFINKLFCSLIIPTSLLIFNITAFKPLKWLHILKVAINAFSVTCCSVIFGFVFSLYCATWFV